MFRESTRLKVYILYTIITVAIGFAFYKAGYNIESADTFIVGILVAWAINSGLNFLL